MHSRAEFYVAYDGPALQSHEMDVKELAPALLALSEVIEGANRVLNGDKTKVALSVKGTFKEGSFGIDLIVEQAVQGLGLLGHVWNDVASLMKSDDVVAAKTILEWVGVLGCGSVGSALFELIKWIRGRRIEKVVPSSDNVVIFILADGDTLGVKAPIADMYGDYQIRKGLDGAINQPLHREGIDSFKCSPSKESEQADTFQIQKKEAAYFESPPEEDTLFSEETRVVPLQLCSIAFKDGNKWRFRDGTSEFHAVINDQEFLSRVDRDQITFAKHDTLEVEMEERHYLSSKGLKSERVIRKVKRIVPSPRRIRLPFEQE